MVRSEMMERMPASEFVEWMVLEQIEPFGDRRADILAGIIAATVANVNRVKGQKPMAPEDFMIKWEKPAAKVQSPNDQLARMLLFQKIQNARVANG